MNAAPPVIHRHTIKSTRVLLIVVGIMLCELVAGVNTTWGNVILYMASYLNQYNSSATLSSLAMAAFANPVGWMFGSMFGTWLYHHIGGRLAVGVGLLITIAGFVISAFVENMYSFLAVYLGCSGFGPAVIVFPGMFLSWTCDPRRKGLLTGMVLGSYGIGGVIYALGFSFLVNPNNETPDKEIKVGDETERIFGADVANRVPNALLICAGISLVISIPGLLLMKDRSNRGDRVSVTSTIIPTLKNRSVAFAHCPSVRAAMRTSAMWNLFIYSFCSYIFPVFVATQFKNYAQRHTRNDQLLSTVGAFALLANTLGRFGISWLMDYVTFKQISLVVCALLAAMGVAIPFIVDYVFIYAVCVCIVFLGYTCLFSPISLVCVNIFGTMVASDVFVIVHIGGTLASFINIPLVLCVINVYGYSMAFYVCAVCAGLAILCVFTLRMKYSWKDSLLGPLTITKP